MPASLVTTKRRHVEVRYLKLGVEQGTVDVKRQQADGRRGHNRFYHPNQDSQRRYMSKPNGPTLHAILQHAHGNFQCIVESL